MVKAARRRWRGAYGSRYSGKARFNYIASNYMKYKIKGHFNVQWTALDDLLGNTSITLEDIFAKGNEFNTLKSYFLLYKLTGVAITIVPIVNADGNGVFDSGTSQLVGSLIQASELNSFAGVSNSPNAFSLGTEKVTKYVKVNTSWIGTSLNVLPSFKVCFVQNNRPAAGSINYAIQITAYLLFKDHA